MAKELKDTKKSVEDTVSSVVPSTEAVEVKTPKILDTEVQTLQYYEKTFQQLLFTLGKISLGITDLEAQKTQVMEEFTKMRQQEAGFSQILTAKYGEVGIDIQTGEISQKK